MDRREALKNTSRIIGAGVFGPAIVSFFQSCQDSDISQDGLPVALTLPQFKTLNIVSDIIIPGTESASATDAKVPSFIDLLVGNIFDTNLSNQVREGLEQIENIRLFDDSHPFSDQSLEDQQLIVQKLDNAAFEIESGIEFEKDILANYKSIKGLVLMAYFTSEKGVTENLDYSPVPGIYEACIDVSEDTRIAVGNHI